MVGVDGSPASKVAVDWAARDAAMRGVTLTLIHVVRSVFAPLSQTPLPTGFGEWQKRQGHQFLDDAIRTVAAATTDSPVQVRTEMYYSATVPTLVDLSKGTSSCTPRHIGTSHSSAGS